jgi:hypothetical protein
MTSEQGEMDRYEAQDEKDKIFTLNILQHYSIIP